MRNAALLLLPLLAIGLLWPTAGAQVPAPPLDPNRFAGKVGVFFTQSALPEDAITLRDAKFERVHDRWFLTGTGPDVGDPADWTADAQVGVDWARVELYYVLTEEQFQERVVEAAEGEVRAL